MRYKAMDTSNSNAKEPGYLLARLFARIELQEGAALLVLHDVGLQRTKSTVQMNLFSIQRVGSTCNILHCLI
jgi:hypothetical protein